MRQPHTLYNLFRLGEEVCNRILFAAAARFRQQYGVSNHRPRILISKLDAIGDFIIFSASLPRLRKLFPDAHLVLLVRSDVYNLAENCPYVDEIWTINQRLFRRNVREHLRWFHALRKGRFDMAINAVYSSNVDFFNCLIGWTAAPRRVGFECLSEERSKLAISNYYTEYVADQSTSQLLEITRNATLLAYLGDHTSQQNITEVWLTEADRKSVADLLARFDIREYAVLFPGARDSYRSWGVTKFTAFAKQIAFTMEITWVLAGGPADKLLCCALEQELRAIDISVYNISGETTLRQLACLIDGAKLCVSSETCAVHIAAAVSTPCLCIMGGGHYGRFYPYPENPMTEAVTNKLPCFNCNWICTRKTVECIRGITVEQAVTALTKFKKSGLLT